MWSSEKMASFPQLLHGIVYLETDINLSNSIEVNESPRRVIWRFQQFFSGPTAQGFLDQEQGRHVSEVPKDQTRGEAAGFVSRGDRVTMACLMVANPVPRTTMENKDYATKTVSMFLREH